MLAERVADIQNALAEMEADGWLFACFQNNDPISLELLGLGGDHLVSRRCYYLIPAQGEPRRLVHKLEPAQLDHLPGSKSSYLSWREHRAEFEKLLAGMKKIAAQYSSDNALPTISRLDAGTAELIRSLGIQIESAAELAQRFAAVWSEEQLNGHRRACTHLHEIVKLAFAEVAQVLKAGAEADEYTIQKFILNQMDQRGLWTDSPPIVGRNEHAADPHYQPTAEVTSPIRKGDFLLIDLWAKEKAAADSIYGDITWCGVCDVAPTDKQVELFSTVVQARDAAWELISSRYPDKSVRGFEVDDACREVIEAAGYGEFFIHRTGHSIGTQTHGQGANMDNLETHDTRRLEPMTGFSIEPGIYLEGDFGVRTEINVALPPDAAEITGGDRQMELLRLLA